MLSLADQCTIALAVTTIITGVFVSGQMVLCGVVGFLIYSAMPRPLKIRDRRSPVSPLPQAPEQPSPTMLLLVPVALLAEKLSAKWRIVSGHSVVPLYVAIFVAVAATRPAAERVAVALFGVGMSLWLGYLHPAMGLEFAAGAVVAVLTEARLALSIGIGEAHLVGALCGLVATSVAGSAMVEPPPSIMAYSSPSVVFAGVLLAAAWCTAAAVSFLRPRLEARGAALRSVVFAVVVAVSTAVGIALGVRKMPRLSSWALVFAGDTRLPALLPFVAIPHRAQLAIVWAVGVSAAAGATFMMRDRMSLVVTRKVFHFIAVLAFTAPSVMDPEFMTAAWGGAIAVGALIEAGRCFELPGHDTVTRLLRGVTDRRDQEQGVYRTHLYLMVGCALPVFLGHRVQYRVLAKEPWSNTALRDVVPGLGGLGVLDAVAAVVGSQFGQLRWRDVLGTGSLQRSTAIGHKTVLGSVAGFVALIFFATLMLAFVATHVATSAHSEAALGVSRVMLQPLGVVAFAAVGAAMAAYETVTDGIDNLELPVFGIALTHLASLV